jgi:hypothetical protein
LISPQNNARGYEWDFGLGQNVIVVRWNGGLDDYTVLGDPNGNLANGKGWTDTPSGSGVIGGLNDGDDVYISYVVTFSVRAFADGSDHDDVSPMAAQVYTVSDTSDISLDVGLAGLGIFRATRCERSSKRTME